MAAAATSGAPSDTAAPPLAPPYSVRLDPDTARNLAANGATLLLLDVPAGTPIGIDQQVFISGPRFRGVKMMPPGVHLLSYQARGRDGALGPPVSTLLALAPRQVVVRRWDAAGEGLEPLGDGDEEARYAAGAARFDFDRELAPYDLGRYSQWVSLSCHVTPALLQMLLPADGEISVMAEATDPQLMAPTSEPERRLQQQLEEGRARLAAAMQVDRPAEAGGEQQQQQQQQPPVEAANAEPRAKGGRCRYSRLARVVKLPGAPAAQLTALNMDKTPLLEQAMARYEQGGGGGGGGAAAAAAAPETAAAADGRQQQQQQQQAPAAPAPRGIALVGELQFAFIAFVFGQSLEGFLQWKQLLVLLLGCVAGPLETHARLFEVALAAVTAQLQFGLGVGAGGRGGRAAPGGDEAAAGAPPPGAALLGGGLVDELLPDSFLRGAFRGFFESLHEAQAQAPAALLAQARQLESLLAAGLGWDFRLAALRLGSDDSDGDEDGPVVVELSDAELAAALAAAGGPR